MPFYDFHLSTFLRKDIPLEIYQTLSYMVKEEKLNKPEYTKYAKTKLFQYGNWDIFLNKDIPHFPTIASSNLRQTQSNIMLTINCSFLAANEGIIIEFLEWLKPYFLKTNDFIGYYRVYGNDINDVSFVCLEGGKLIYKKL